MSNIRYVHIRPTKKFWRGTKKSSEDNLLAKLTYSSAKCRRCAGVEEQHGGFFDSFALAGMAAGRARFMEHGIGGTEMETGRTGIVAACGARQRT